MTDRTPDRTPAPDGTEVRPQDPQTRVEQEEFARGHLPEGATPTTPIPAATTVVARPGTAGSYEVLLLKRPDTSSFAAGAFVFPGGVVDRDDEGPFWRQRLPPLGNLPESGRAACTAALRELFEETGLLLPDGPGPGPADLREAREELLGGGSFRKIAQRHDLRFTSLRIAYFARWITPARLARRYDTRFFFIALDDPASRATITDEHAAKLWTGPVAGLEAQRSGRLPMLFPTWKTLERLASHADLDRALDALRDTRVAPIEPRLVVRDGAVRPRLPDSTAG